MKYYRIVFAKNEVISCSEAKDTHKAENIVEHQNGQVIFALVKASDEEEAIAIGKSRLCRCGKHILKIKNRESYISIILLIVAIILGASLYKRLR